MKMKNIKLTEEEVEYFKSAVFLEKYLKCIVFNSMACKKKIFTLIISEELVDELRDVFGEQMELTGFDENYEPNKEGRILESLIDKFFIDDK